MPPDNNLDPFGLRRAAEAARRGPNHIKFLFMFVGVGIVTSFLVLASLAPQIGNKLGTLSVKKQTQESEAARGDKGGNPNKSSAILWVEPSLASYPAYGYQLTILGSGFNPNSVVQISQTPNGAISNVLADSDGNITFSWSTGAPGTYTFSTYQDLKGNRWTIYAQVTVQVVSQ